MNNYDRILLRINCYLMVDVDQRNLKQFYRFLLMKKEDFDDIIEDLWVRVNFYNREKKGDEIE